LLKTKFSCDLTGWLPEEPLSLPELPDLGWKEESDVEE
jgi:hypothetical protein